MASWPIIGPLLAECVQPFDDYNGKLRSAELLLRENGQVIGEIRRAETVDDHFATLDFDKLADFS